MSGENWTPGPWGVNCTGDVVAEIADGIWVQATKIGPDPQSDAHLIAASPKLYKAAESAEEMLVSIIGVYGDNGASFVVEELREAMAEARGESE